MKKLLQIMLYLGLLLLAFLVLASAVYFGYEQYRKMAWAMFDREGDIYLGMSRDDLFFKVNVRLECLLDVDEKKPVFSRVVDKDREFRTQECDHLGLPTPADDDFTGVYDLRNVRLRDDRVVWWSSSPGSLSNRFPFDGYDVNEMISVLGEPDFLWISRGLKTRKYTYLKHRTIFVWYEDRLTSYNTGDIRWLDTVDVSPDWEYLKNPEGGWRTRLQGKYFIRNTQICPSSNCPFNDDGSLKNEYLGMSLVDFVQRK